MIKLMSLAAIAAVATLAVPMAATPAAARDHHMRWKTVCKTTWRHGHKHKMCHKVRW